MTWVGAGVAAVEVGSSLYEGSQNEKAAKSANQANAWRGQAAQDLVKRSQTIADRPYTPYTGERVAGLDPNEITAEGIAAQSADPNSAANQMYTKAGQQADFIAGNGWSDATAKKYMDPYVGEVVNQALRKEQDTYAQQENARRGSAAQVGAFGGDRDAILEAQGEKAHNQNVSDITTSGYADAYKSAIGTWQADNQRAYSAAAAYDQVGGDITRMNSEDITNLIKTGQTGRLLRQAQLDTNYSDYVEKRDWSVTNLQPLLKAVGESNNSPAQVPNESHAIGQTLGALSTVAGYFGQQYTDNQTAQNQSDVNSGVGKLYSDIGNDPNYFGNFQPTEIGGAQYGNNAAEGY